MFLECHQVHCLEFRIVLVLEGHCSFCYQSKGWGYPGSVAFQNFLDDVILHSVPLMNDYSLVGNQRNNTSEINAPVSLSFSMFSQVRLLEQERRSHRKIRQLQTILAAHIPQKGRNSLSFTHSRMPQTLSSRGSSQERTTWHGNG